MRYKVTVYLWVVSLNGDEMDMKTISQPVKQAGEEVIYQPCSLATCSFSHA